MKRRKNPHAVALGRLGGRTVTPVKIKHLRRIAALGAAVRWGNKRLEAKERQAVKRKKAAQA